MNNLLNCLPKTMGAVPPWLNDALKPVDQRCPILWTQ